MIEGELTFNSTTRLRLKPKDGKDKTLLQMAFENGEVKAIRHNQDGSWELEITQKATTSEKSRDSHD